jgi:RimJ/RimL family protein N-acetyltransferase
MGTVRADMPSFPDFDEPLSGQEVQLRLAAERDIPEILIAHQDDPLLAARLGLARPPSGAELGRRTEEAAAERAEGSGVYLTILRPGSDECRGQLDVHDVDWDHRRAQLGIWVAPGERGQGLARGALAVVGAWLLQACGLMRVDLLTEPDNQALIRAAEAAGFRPEGVLRSYLREHRHRVDVAVMSLIPADLGAL